MTTKERHKRKNVSSFCSVERGSLEEVTVAAGRASENASQRSITGVRDHTCPYEHDLLGARDVVDMIAEGNEQVEEELGAAIEHLELHGTAPLEGAAAPDDEGKVVRPQLGVGVGRISVGVPGRRQYGAALNARLQALLSQRDTLELLEPVLIGGAVDDGVLQDVTINAVVVDRHLWGGASPSALFRRLELPRVLTLVVDKAGVVVALVEVLKDGGEDLGLLVWQVHALGVLRVHVLLG